MNATIFKKLVNVLTLLSFFSWNLAIATPEGGSVAQGSAAINQTGTLTTVTQTSQNTVINWSGFNTASNEAVNFVQPNSSAVALNRINSGAPTTFAGSLSANGQVWILNPNGVLFTSTSKVDVAGLLVTTHNITDSNFMSGNYQFNSVSGFENSKVINNGTITVADTGMVALVAPGVENNGMIQANMGKVALASGTAFVLDLYGDNLINFGNSAPAQSGYVSNAGKIVANGGKVYLTANSAAKMVDNVINMSGVIEARSVGTSHGKIVLNGGKHGKVRVSGKLNTSNVNPNGTGGFIETSGDTLDIALGAVDPGKGGTWSVDPTLLIIDTNPGNGDWVDQIQNAINGTFSISLSADTILVMESINAYGGCNVYCYPTLYLTANNLLDVLASINLTYANLHLVSYGVLQTSSLATLSVYSGYIYLAATTLLEVDGPLSSQFGQTTLYSNSNIFINNTFTANYGFVSISTGGGGGNITINGSLDMWNQEAVEIFADGNITVNGPITTHNAYLDIEAGHYDSFGDLTINSGGEITATNNSVKLSASNSVDIDAPVSVHGGNLSVYAYGWDYGVISVDAPILLDTIEDGDAYLWAWNEIDVNDTITVNDGGFQALAVFGNVNVYDAISALDYLNLFAYYNVYSNSDGALTVTDGSLNVQGGYCYYGCSYYGYVTLNAPVSVMNGDAYIFAPDSVTTNDTIDVTDGGLELETDYYSIHMNGEVTVTGTDNAYFDAYAGGSVHIDAPVTVTNTDGYYDGEEDFAIDIEAGSDHWWGKVYINDPIMLDGGDAYIYASNNIYVNDTITVTNGSLDISTGGGGGNIYINDTILVDYYVDIDADNSVYVYAPITVNYDGITIEADGDDYGVLSINAPIIANGSSYFFAADRIYINSGVTVYDGSLEFETNYWGKININTSDPIMADGNVYFDDRVYLQSDTTVTSNFGNVFFDRTVDSGWCLEVAANLTVNVLNGFVKFRDNVGDNNPLNNLVINGMTKFCNWCESLDVITFLSQIYNGAVTSNTDMLMLTIQNGAIFLNSGYSAPDNYLTLVTGADSDFTGGGTFGDSINVYGLTFGGTGSADLTNTTINGFGGSDAFGQVDIEGTGSHYCVNGVGIGGCGSIPLNIITQAQTIPTSPTSTNGVWSVMITDANGNVIEMCDEHGCVMNIVKNPA